jgi:deoxyadenosine/deoxycytidine kinase
MTETSSAETTMTKRFVVVAGNIGSGKTSITERIGARLGWRTAFESVTDNPYLAEFYADMRQWSFHLQVFFLGHRSQQHLALARAPDSAISDRSIYEDAYIFARALYHLGNLNERDYRSFRTVFDLVVGGLPKPDLLLYLRAPVPVLMRRIHGRGRSMESGITADYLALLETFYDDWLKTFDLCPVLTVQTDDLDFVHRTKHLDIVAQRIQDRLAGQESIVFPSEANDR